MRRAIIILFLLSSPLYAGKKKSMGAMYVKPGQKFEIANASQSLSMAHRKCENNVWAAIVESMMRAQQVNISQDQWSLRTSNGDTCAPSLSDYARRAQAISGDYSLNGGRKVRIQADYAEGPPQPNTMLYSLRVGRPLMLVWNGRPYLLYGVVYDELVHSSGNANDFIVKELHLLDAALPATDPKRMVIVKKEGNGDALIAGIGGVMSVNVENRNFYDVPSH